jgi:hypothetical protein
VFRVPAILLVALLSFLLIAPGSYVSSESRLPICCRSHGLHKCAMGSDASTASNAGPVVRGLCPFANQHQPGVAGASRLTLPSTASAVFAELVSHPATRPQVIAFARVSLLRSCQKRGPPALFS